MKQLSGLDAAFLTLENRGLPRRELDKLLKLAHEVEDA